MILTRTPLRIPIGGGGTDLPGFYEKHGSFFISAAIDYYVYVAVKRRPIHGIRLGYSEIEEVSKISDIKHPIIKGALKLIKIDVSRGLEIVSMGDFPGGTGMGSSGSFTVGLVNALYHLEKNAKPPHVIAHESAYLNMNILKMPSGKQDEYIAAFGGFTCFEISKKGVVKSYPLKISYETINDLQNNLLLFYTGIRRGSEQILAKQNEASVRSDAHMMQNLKKIQALAYEIQVALESGNTRLFGKLLDEHWKIKREREATSNSQIDSWYSIAKKSGALGGKILGAGGGGFFAFYCPTQKETLRKNLTKEGLEEVKYHFDFEGTKLLANI